MTEPQHQSAPEPRPGERLALAGGEWGGLRLVCAVENIAEPTLWTFNEPQHVIVTHLGGTIRNLRMRMERGGNLREPPAGGEMFVIPARHAYRTEAVGGMVRYAELYIDPGALAAIPGRTAASELRPRLGYFDPFVHQAVLRLAAWAARRDDLASLAAGSLAQTLMLHLADKLAVEPPRTAASPHVRLSPAGIRTIEEYIAGHLDGPIVLEQLAAQARLTTHELLTAFRAAFGTTPAQYVIERRLFRARRLLLTTTKSIAAIAVETGFASHSHLTDTFRARLGCTPSQLRGRRSVSGG